MQLFGGLTNRIRAFEKIKTTHHYSEEVVSETIFVNVVPPRLAVHIEGGLEGQHHSIHQFVEYAGHGGMLLSPKPEHSDGPARWTPLLDTPKRQPGAHQEVLMRNFVQGPDSGIICNPGLEIEDGESISGAVASRREDGLQENAKTRPGSESRQPEAEEPVSLRSGFWTRHTTPEGVKSEGQYGRRAVRPFMEKPMRVAKVLRTVAQ
jgi:hypothetical protein